MITPKTLTFAGLIAGSLVLGQAMPAMAACTATDHSSCYADPAIQSLQNQLGLTLGSHPNGYVQVGFILNPSLTQGLEVGDQIWSVNGSPITSVFALVNAANDARARFGGQMNMTVRDVRTGGFVYVTLFI